MSDGSGPRRIHESAELARLRAEIDELDRRIVGLLNERAELVRAVGHEKLALGRRWVRDREREREVLLRVSIANEGPTPQADLLAIYRRLIASARALETLERDATPARRGRARRSRRARDARAPATTPLRASARPAGCISAISPTRSTSGASPGGSAARVILRIEDHDRQRCRPEYETALLDDLDRLGIAADEPSTDDLRAGPSPFRQSDNGAAYAAALERLSTHDGRLCLRLHPIDIRRVARGERPAVERPGLPGRLPVARARATSGSRPSRRPR